MLVLDPNLKGLFMLASFDSFLFGSNGFGFLTSTTSTSTPPFSILLAQISNFTFSYPGTKIKLLALKFGIEENSESITVTLPRVSKYNVVSSAP